MLKLNNMKERKEVNDERRNKRNNQEAVIR